MHCHPLASHRCRAVFVACVLTVLCSLAPTSSNAAIPYSAGTTYHFRLVVSVPAHTYSVYVRSGSGAEQLLASNFSFRTEQASASALNNLGLYASVGSETVCKLAVTVANDTTPSTVSMTAPPAGSTLAGTVTVSASASDNVGVVGVQFKLDGANLGAEVTAASHTLSWNTATTTNAAHSLTAVARDAAGNVTTSSVVSGTVANLTVSITAPLNGATLANLTKVTVQATSSIGLSSIQVYGDSILIGTVSCTTSSCSDLTGTVNWHTNNLARGPHSLYEVATDILGNSTSTTPITVIK